MNNITLVFVMPLILLILAVAGLSAYLLSQRKDVEKRLKAAKEEGTFEFLEMLITQGHQSRLEWFRFLNNKAQKGGTLFVGDSLTQEFLLEEYFGGSLVYNRGIGGDTTEGLLDRMEESVYALMPSKMFLLIGTNDLALKQSPPEVVVENIKNIVLNTKEHCRDTEIFIESLYPTGAEGFRDLSSESIKNRSNYVIDIINEKLKLLCQELGIRYIDVNSKLKDKEGKLNPTFTRDGLHLNPRGYEVVIDCLKQYM